MANVTENQIICGNCGTRSKSCKLCSRCHMTYYCSKDCQKDAFIKHKSACCNIHRNAKALAILEKETHDHRQDKFWRDCVGLFWAFSELRKYCETRYRLGQFLVELGALENNPKAYEAGLAHYLELLRLAQKDPQQVRNYVPFILLVLNRREDCYGFIKWWALVEYDGNRDWSKARNYKEGEWVYLRNENIEDDLFEHKVLKGKKFYNACHIAALILLKLLIIKDKEKELNAARTAFMMGTTEMYGKDSPIFQLANKHPILDKILCYMKLNSGLPEQEKLFHKYCKMSDSNNKIILKALVNPGPLFAQGAPNVIGQGSPFEANMVIKGGRYAFEKLDMLPKLREIYGRDPSYSCQKPITNMSDILKLF